jgi:thioredoxin 1
MVSAFKQEMVEKSSKPVIIKAFATWCPHCAVMAPIYEKLSKENPKYEFTEFDVDQAEDLTKSWGVTGLPTFIFVKGKKEVGRELGEMSEEALKKAIEKYLG